MALPRVAADQFRTGAPVARADLIAGDVVCFDDYAATSVTSASTPATSASRHAPHTGAVIGDSALSEPYYSARFAGGRR